MDEDDAFAEETMGLYYPTKGRLVLQQHREGCSPYRIETYLSNYVDGVVNNYCLTPVLDPEAVAKLAKKGMRSRRLDFKIARTELTPQLRSSNVALEQAIRIGEMTNAAQISIGLSMGKAKGSVLNQDTTKGILDALMKMIRLDSGVIPSAEVSVVNELGGPGEIIDLVAHRLVQRIDGLELGAGKRYTTESRWNAIHRAAEAWKQHLQ